MAWILISAESGWSVWGASAWLVVGKPPHTAPSVKAHPRHFPSFSLFIYPAESSKGDGVIWLEHPPSCRRRSRAVH